MDHYWKTKKAHRKRTLRFSLLFKRPHALVCILDLFTVQSVGVVKNVMSCKSSKQVFISQVKSVQIQVLPFSCFVAMVTVI